MTEARSLKGKIVLGVVALLAALSYAWRTPDDRVIPLAASGVVLLGLFVFVRRLLELPPDEFDPSQGTHD
jgi:hypothetical protein